MESSRLASLRPWSITRPSSSALPVMTSFFFSWYASKRLSSSSRRSRASRKVGAFDTRACIAACASFSLPWSERSIACEYATRASRLGTFALRRFASSGASFASIAAITLPASSCSRSKIRSWSFFTRVASTSLRVWMSTSRASTTSSRPCSTMEPVSR